MKKFWQVATIILIAVTGFVWGTLAGIVFQVHRDMENRNYKPLPRSEGVWINKGDTVVININHY